MKRIKPPMPKFFRLILICLLASSAAWAQPIDLSIEGVGSNRFEGCEDYEVTFIALVPGSATIDDMELISGDGTETYIRKNEWKLVSGTYQFTYSFPAGKYNPILRVKRGGGDWEEALLDRTINVYTLPTAMFRVVGDSSQCLDDNEVFFKDLSTTGTEGHRITGHTFDLGDGTFVFDKEAFSYSYIKSDTYTTVLTVRDEKGCANEITIDDHVEIYRDVEVDFLVAGLDGCPCTDIRFNNRTEIDQDKVDYWVWDWGTGNGKKSKDTFYMSNPDHKDNWWTGFRRRYCKDGYHSPKLVVVSKDGCSDSLLLKNAITVVNYKFDITWVPDTSCFTGNNVRFNMPERPNAIGNEWSFGDPASQLLNTARDDWSPSHSFQGGPGFYNITLSIMEPPCPLRDTTICFVKLKGPMAIISLDPMAFPNNCLDPKEIPKSHFLRLKYDECYRESIGLQPDDDLVSWVTANTTNRVIADRYFVYCNAKVIGQVPNNAVSAFGAGTDVCNDQVVTRTIPVLEAPDEGVNGSWRNQYRGFTQSRPNVWKLTDPMPYLDSLKITDSLSPVNGGAKVETTFWVYQPFLGLHSVSYNGVEYIYRIAKSPITHDGGVYRPPMFPGTTQADGCDNDFRNMHDTDMVTRNCTGPNLVQFTNNSIKYRMRGRSKSEKPPHTFDALDNMPDAFSFPNSLDSCKDNINWPFASDSLRYFWDFGDNGDRCTTYFDANRDVQVKGDNPSGDPLQCQFSELPVPQHFYVDEGCWTATLSATDPLTGCTSTTTQTIIMEAPNAGPADPAGLLTKGDVNFNNQTQIQKDEDGDDFRIGLQLGRGDAPCVNNDLNPYFQAIDLSGTLPSCGRETFWMIFNRDDAYLGEDDDPTDNDCERKECTTDGNGFIVKNSIKSRGAFHEEGTYEVEWRVDNVDGTWGPAYAKGKATINGLGFLERVQITQDKGGYFNKAKPRMVFVDSSAFNLSDVVQNPIEVYGYEQLDSFWYECNWYDEQAIVAAGMQWIYTTSGCKTPGLVIKTGDCFDTFFYENYRYFLDANADFFMNPHPNRYVNEEEIRATLDLLDKNPVRQDVYKDVNHIFCQTPDSGNPDILPTRLPYEITFSVKDYSRNDPMAPDADSVCEALDSVRDFKFFISKTANQCGTVTNGLPADSLSRLSGGFQPVLNGDIDLSNLRDTLKWTIKSPGKYTISSTSRAKHGIYSCFGSQSREVWIGQLQCFRYSDSVVCKEQPVTFVDSIYYWNPEGTGGCDNLFINTTCIDLKPYFYIPTHDSVRSDKWSNARFTEVVAWDFNTPRFKTDAKGDTLVDALGQPIRMKDWMLQMDSSKVEVWIDPTELSEAEQDKYWEKYAVGLPFFRETEWTYGATEEFGPGIYDVTLWARDSMGCWMPYTKHDAIRVVDVEAKFTLCDTCKGNLTCTPAATGFKDLSEIIENKQDAPPTGRSLTKGVFDEIVEWDWSFGDGRANAVIQHAGHTYFDANEDGYDVALTVRTAQGCTSTHTIPTYVKVIGPKAHFTLLNDTICVEDSIYFIDNSESKVEAVRIWYSQNVATGLAGNTKNTDGKVKRVGLFFDEPGDYYVVQRLSGLVENPITGVKKNCQDDYPNDEAGEEKIKVHVRDFDLLKITLSDTLFCPDDIIDARVAAESYEGYDSFYWKIEGKDTAGLRTTVQEFTFDQEGTYTISLTGSGRQPICPTTDVATVRVKTVTAQLGVDWSRSNLDLGNYEFTNSSTNGKLHVWEIYEESSRRTPIATFIEGDTSRLVYKDFVAGTYFIKLLVYDEANPSDSLLGCRGIDTLSIVVDPQIEFYNVFSPNTDGANDLWSITMQAIPEYELVIYNRWGELMYKASQDDDVPCELNARTGKRACKFWDGTNMRNGRKAPAGTYYYVFKYRFKGEEVLKTVNGSITLLRGRGQ